MAALTSPAKGPMAVGSPVDGAPGEHGHPGSGGLSAGTGSCDVARLAARVAEAVAAAPPRLGPTSLICLDGPSGAGKTTLAAALPAAFAAERAPAAAGPVRPLLARPIAIVHMDDLYGGWDGIDAGWDRLSEWVLGPLGAGRAARFRAFDWTAGEFGGPAREVAPGALLVVEGCGSAPRRADRFASLIVWLDGPADVRRERALARDGVAMASQLERWAAREAAHFAREDTAARAGLRLFSA